MNVKLRFKLLISLMVVFILSVSWSQGNIVQAAPASVSRIIVTVDREELSFDVPPAIIEGRTMVPLRAIFEALEAQVEWNGTTKTVTGARGNTNIKLVVGSKLAAINGKEVQLDVPATIISSRTLVPVRFISESLGAKVSWDAKLRKVTILTQDVIDIPDNNFEKIIRKNIKKYSGDIFSSDLKQIEALEARKADITDLEGIQYMKNVRAIYMEENNISDISLLSGLNKLEVISLSENRISDISPLAGLANLRIVYLHTNLIRDLTPLKSLTNLKELYLGGNYIKEIGALSSLIKLESLYIGDNQILDMSVLKNLSNLKQLDIFANSTLDITPLKSLKRLEEVYVDHYNEESALDDKLYNKYNDMMSKTKDIVAKVIKPGMSDLEKELALHDYLVFNTVYDYENYMSDTVSDEAHQPYGVLVNKVAVCDGFARTMQILLDMVGIESEFVHGSSEGDRGWNGHAWNIVKIDGKYYHLDVTYNNIDKDNAEIENDSITHTYFNISDRQMSVDHKWDKNAYPSCDIDSDFYSRISELRKDRIIDGDTAYYLDRTGSIVKINLVDFTTSKLSTKKAKKIVLSDGYIYYIVSDKSENGIYKLRTDRTGETKVYEGDANLIAENDGNIYYIDEDGIINSLNKSGTGTQELNNNSVASAMYFTEDYIIYKAYKWNRGGQLYRITKDTLETDKIVSDTPVGFSFSSDSGFLTYYYAHLERVIDDWIYYVNESKGNSLYKVKVDGTSRTSLNSSDSTIIDIIGEWVYYHNNSDNSKVYRVKTDGSEDSKVQE